MVKILIDTRDWDLALEFQDAPFTARLRIAWLLLKKSRKPSKLWLFCCFLGISVVLPVAPWYLLFTLSALMTCMPLLLYHEGLLPMLWCLLRGDSTVYMSFDVRDGMQLFFAVMLVSEAGYERGTSVILATTGLEMPLKDWIESHECDFDIEGFGVFMDWKEARKERLSWATRIKARCQ